jgi:chemotaxis protein MotB
MKKEEENMEKIKKQLDQYIKDNKLTNQLNTKLNQSQLLITISDTALFSSGSATVKPESRSLAVALSDMLVQFPGYEVIITGHTDNQPISNSEFESNWELSSTRASKFMKILLQNQSLDPKLFSVIGQGEYRPIASNNTNIGRAQNRRVEISIMRKFVDNGTDQKITVKK